MLNTKIIYHPSTKDKLILLLNYANSPQADDAGALTKIQADTMPQMARDVNLRFDAGESLQQGRAGLIWEHKLDSRQQLKAKVFYTGRDFENKLAFANSGIVHLGRNFTGGGLSYIFQRRFENTVYRLQTGLEIEDQRDLRQRYQNENGVRGALVFDQLEKFQTTGLYALNSLNIRKKFEINASLRFDLIHYTAEDHFTTDGDDSGSRTLQNLSPGIGLCYEISHKLYVFANYSTSFETPALSELSANPDGGGGFNTGLNPQRSNSFEAGIRGLPNARLRFELTAFRAYGRDELAPYELPAFPGRVFYRNSAQSSRKGLEADVQWIPFRNWILHSTYSLGDYRYVQYSSPTAVFDGKHMPVLPKHIAFAELGYRRSRGLFTFVQYRYTGSMYADDGNQTAVNASFIWALRGGYRLSGARFDWELFGGINNLFDTFYYNNIRPNAAAARYYEPGAGRNFYVGLRLNLHQNKAHE